MRIFLLSIFFIFFVSRVFSQQFFHYNTGTLYEGFENPAVQTFTPDSSRQYAFNLFLPNVYGSFHITGNAQPSLRSRAFDGRYENSNLLIGQGAINRLRENANIYFIMYKAFIGINNNAELGFSVQSREEGRGFLTDESVALFNGPGAFANNTYDNIFNNDLQYQSYHQISFSFREKASKQFAYGIKLSGLLGIQYQKLTVNQSQIEFDRPMDRAFVSMAGTYLIDYTPGKFTLHDNLPTFRNPGASITLGTTYRTRDNFNLQANLKDLGFIRWSNRSTTYKFNAADVIEGLSTENREDNVFGANHRIIHSGANQGSFVTATNARAELSANKSYWLGYEKKFRYSPTIIVSKELFYNGLTVAMINPVTYKNLTLSATTSYDQYKILSAGGQMLIKSPNAEFFIGSEKLIQSGRLLLAANGNSTEINRNSFYTGADIFLGFSLKFGAVIEHPMNASDVPLNAKRTFFDRLWSRLFNHGD
ncbi:DUF5723 family protein [Mucilaginibacter glaciei]|uniref:DUF5723 domain-containing protein n=1 Tax=Mucilaginibacter glaciei TaxID=2772109 RepID=A0A926S150_9SPHI|nr:DUF5723 family protein [Mucilaginibacter glaciei]MBD1391794.1 hypothetical protein [Mucilaginibacter glaciei]